MSTGQYTKLSPKQLEKTREAMNTLLENKGAEIYTTHHYPLCIDINGVHAKAMPYVRGLMDRIDIFTEHTHNRFHLNKLVSMADVQAKLNPELGRMIEEGYEEIGEMRPRKLHYEGKIAETAPGQEIE